jgi:hypothetical protein
VGAPHGRLPGEELVSVGVRDLESGHRSVEALLVARAASRLRACGVPVPEHRITDPDGELYDLLASREGTAAHSAYNALSRRLVSYLNAAERHAQAR